jgi:hypothetical protein
MIDLLVADVGDGGSIASWITQIGLSGVFLWLYFDATRERRAAQKALTDVLERVLPLIEAATATLERVQISMKMQVERAETQGTRSPLSSTSEIDTAIRRLEDVNRDFLRRLESDVEQSRRRDEDR